MRWRGGRFFSQLEPAGPDQGDDVAGLIADIAAIFHWPLSELLALELDELLRWQRLAADRWKKMHGKGKG
jgi:hypothetical protein